MARSAATVEAFESLLNFGITHKGRPDIVGIVILIRRRRQGAAPAAS